MKRTCHPTNKKLVIFFIKSSEFWIRWRWWRVWGRIHKWWRDDTSGWICKRASLWRTPSPPRPRPQRPAIHDVVALWWYRTWAYTTTTHSSPGQARHFRVCGESGSPRRKNAGICASTTSCLWICFAANGGERGGGLGVFHLPGQHGREWCQDMPPSCRLSHFPWCLPAEVVRANPHLPHL